MEGHQIESKLDSCIWQVYTECHLYIKDCSQHWERKINRQSSGMGVHSGGDKQTIKSYHRMSYYDEYQEEKVGMGLGGPYLRREHVNRDLNEVSRVDEVVM